MSERCFACGKPLGARPLAVDTRDDQIVSVGRECAKLILAAGTEGYQPPRGGPRLYPLPTVAGFYMVDALAGRDEVYVTTFAYRRGPRIARYTFPDYASAGYWIASQTGGSLASTQLNEPK